MVTSNGPQSSGDELFVDGAENDPAPFIFQFDLSDDDAPDPLALDKIAQESLAALSGAASETPPIEKKESWLAAMRAGQTNGITEPPADKPENRVIPVTIEVRLPWLPPARRAAYRRVRVEDYRPEEELPRARRRRRRVSGDFCVLSCWLRNWLWDSGCWVCVSEKRPWQAGAARLMGLRYGGRMRGCFLSSFEPLPASYYPALRGYGRSASVEAPT
ncbi:hypothetical protein N658DRAFT_444213 [Parathielavia hyrcaniae]|uniref:Uncharacterized protein n=1 Tax=Parathielavia hyrcaniae TaxID=113614 RepID=A0AAN6T4A1_9PEZI|nr:hypothetical protein N658DRAFT_444213 [Parathielavia hyrcaniae]